MKRARVAVIGGGLAGLCAAHALQKRGHEVSVLEASENLGGQIQTELRDGYVIELGAEGFVARSEALPRLAQELGIETQLRDQCVTRSLGYRAGELRELLPGEAATFLGFQVPKNDLGLGIRTFARGMGQLIDALARALAANVELHLGWNVASIARRADGYVITHRQGATCKAERVVIATSARHAGKLLSAQLGPAAAPLMAARTMSSVTVSLAYARAAIPHALDATGFVIAKEEQTHGARACAFVSSKFAERAPSDKALLRVFFRPSESDLQLVSDATYSARSAEWITRVLSATAAPEATWVSRWADALPIIDEAQQREVRALETALEGSGIALAGSAFHGAGLDAAVRSAVGVAKRL